MLIDIESFKKLKNNNLLFILYNDEKNLISYFIFIIRSVL